MSTVSTSSTKSKAPQKPAPASAGSGGPAAGAEPGTPARRRRPPVLLLAMVGGALAWAYARLILGMHFGPPLVMVALGGVTLCLSAAALWRVIDPLTRGESPGARPSDAQAPLRTRELEREKQAVLKAIKEIELDYQMRKISQNDYREMVERYRTRALRVMGDLATGDDVRALIERELKARLAARAAAGAGGSEATSAAVPSESAPTSPTASTAATGLSVCGSCGVPNDTDAQFCKRCGQKLAGAASG